VARLAEHGAKTYMGARSASKGNAAIESIKKLYPNADVTLMLMDHNDLASVVSAAKNFLAHETSLHGLVNNAGIMATPFEITKDGYEAQWQTNYLAHYVLTSLLLPLLLSTSKTSPPGTVRIVNLTSSGHWQAPKGGINFEDTSLLKGNGGARYGQSKLANILHAKTLNEMYGPKSDSALQGQGEIWTSAVHPGLVESGLAGRSEGALLATLLSAFRLFGGYTDADTGSWTSVFCVASPEFKKEQSGTYFERIAKAGWQSGNAKDMKLAKKLDTSTRDKMVKEGWVM
jgi:NAD(P)-dependent dehydrogenase (short-subunit alcohol dehydrogenase family)